MKYRSVILSSFLFSTLFFVHYVFSQSTDFDPSILMDANTGLPLGVDEQISIEQIPQIPQAGENVSIRINAYTTNLNKAKITWTQDGKIVLSQTGAVSNQVTAPASGKSSTIGITIQKENGGTIYREIKLNPADVDLVYEAQTYAHPFFKGKKLYTSESDVTFVAIPTFITPAGKKFADQDLVYKWKVNGTVQQSVSGYGKNTFSTKGQLIERPMQVTVDVSAINSSLIATKSINLHSVAPEILIYENNPLLGVVYDKAILGTFFLQRPQVDFEAIPYFFSSVNKDSSNLAYSWTVNGLEVTNKGPNENYLLLQNDKNAEGQANISVTTSHIQNILQTTFSQFGLDFKKVNNTSNEASVF